MIKIDKDVEEYLKKQKTDYRVCTSCSGASLVPVSLSHPKKTDIKMKVGGRTLYISAYQAPAIKKIDKGMLDTGQCSPFE